MLARKPRCERECEQSDKSGSRQRDVKQTIYQQRLRTTFELGADRRQQRIEHRRVVEVIGLPSELEGLRIEEPHARQRWPGVAGVLDMCDVRGMLQLVTGISVRHVLALRAHGCGKHKENEG